MRTHVRIQQMALQITPWSVENLRAILLDLEDRITDLESHPQPQAAPESRETHHHTFWMGHNELRTSDAVVEMPQSGPTSPASDGASPENLAIPPIPETVISEVTSSPWPRGNTLVGLGAPMSLHPQSKTSAPTSSIPSTDRSTGPSASTDENRCPSLIGERQCLFDAGHNGMHEAAAGGNWNTAFFDFHRRDGHPGWFPVPLRLPNQEALDE